VQLIQGAANLFWVVCVGAATEHKKVVLGTKPILLSPFSSGGQRHVFAASDRPTIIYSNNKKLLYSNLNENDVAYLASFSTSSLPDSLALVKGQQLSLGTIDGEQGSLAFTTAATVWTAGLSRVL